MYYFCSAAFIDTGRGYHNIEINLAAGDRLAATRAFRPRKRKGHTKLKGVGIGEFRKVDDLG